MGELSADFEELSRASWCVAFLKEDARRCVVEGRRCNLVRGVGTPVGCGARSDVISQDIGGREAWLEDSLGCTRPKAQVEESPPKE